MLISITINWVNPLLQLNFHSRKGILLVWHHLNCTNDQSLIITPPLPPPTPPPAAAIFKNILLNIPLWDFFCNASLYALADTILGIYSGDLAINIAGLLWEPGLVKGPALQWPGSMLCSWIIQWTWSITIKMTWPAWLFTASQTNSPSTRITPNCTHPPQFLYKKVKSQPNRAWSRKDEIKVYSCKHLQLCMALAFVGWGHRDGWCFHEYSIQLYIENPRCLRIISSSTIFLYKEMKWMSKGTSQHKPSEYILSCNILQSAGKRHRFGHSC